MPRMSTQALERLKASRLKVTPARRKIVEVLSVEHGPFSVEELHQRYLKKTCDLATVYRTITSLEQKSILKRCEFGDGVARYELLDESDHHHHHLVCRQCKRVELIELPKVEESIHTFAKKTGFKKVSHILELFGVCPKCQN